MQLSLSTPQLPAGSTLPEMLDAATIEAATAVGDIIENYLLPFVPENQLEQNLQDLANFDIQPYAGVVAQWLEPILNIFSPRPTTPPQSPTIHWDLADFEDTPPSPFLVGVELNPGPPKAPPALQKILQEVKVMEKAVQHGKKDLGHAPGKQFSWEKGQKPKSNSSPATSVAAAYASGYQTKAPRIKRLANDKFYIEHEELVTTVTGSTGFTINSLIMQPGLSSVFPWLSTQTNGWEKYRFRYLRARYATRTGSGTPGTVMLIPDYDATDALPTSEVAASSFRGSTNDAPWKDALVNFDMGRSKELFLRTGPLGANLDPKTYDFATLSVATQDGTVVSWGKVWLEYGIELITSQAVSLSNLGGGVLSGGGGVTTLIPFGITPQIANGTIVSGISLTEPRQINLVNLIAGGEYVINITATGTTVSNIVITPNLLTLKNGMSSFANAAATQYTIFYTYLATNTYGSFVITTTAASLTQVSTTISPLSNTTPL